MSLLDNGTDTVVVTLMKKTKNSVGGYDFVPDTTNGPYTHKVNVRAVSSKESQELGTQAVTVYKFRCRKWEGGIYSRITWNGRVFDQVGEAKPHQTGSPMIAHYEVVMKARTAEVK